MQWLTRLIIYPFIFVFIFVFAFLINNVGQIDITYFIRPLVFSWLVTAVAIWAVSRITKDKHRAGFLVTLGFTCIFIFNFATQPVTNLLPGQDSNPFALVILLLWILLFVGLGHRWVWNKLSKPALLTFMLNLVLVSSLLYPALQVVQFLLQSNVQTDQDGPGEMYLTFHSEPPVELSGNENPDIYVIVLDAYGRADVLEDLYNIDNRPFLEALEQRGFYIATQSHSNYLQTPLAISAILNFQYHGDWIFPKSVIQRAEFLRAPILKNQVFSLLKDLDYTIVAYETGFSYTELSFVDHYVTPFIRLNPIEQTLLGITPLQLIANFVDLKLPVSNYRTHRTRLENTLGGLKTVHSFPGPKLVVAHILLPHPPFVYDHNGKPLKPEYPFSMMDSDDFLGTPESYYLGYREQVKFVSNTILDVVDQILAGSKNPPAILLQGDHGPRMLYSWEEEESPCMFERTSILNALYIPNVDQEVLYPSLSPVNSFRIIFNTYFDAGLELLPDRTFISTWNSVDGMIDVTGVRNSRDNCDDLFSNEPVEIMQILPPT